MSVAKVLEISASSNNSFEDAIQTGISRVNTSVDQVQGAWIQEQKVVVDAGKITEYRVNMKVTFIVLDGAANTSPAKKTAVRKK